MDLFFKQIEEGGECVGFKEVYGMALAVGLNRILKSDGNLDAIKSEDDFMKLFPPKSSGISFMCRQELHRKGGYSYDDLLEKRL